tara:strand:+ start:1104 stop:2000 length:897 start_codon:yes stop_codon:yes gene_type:complete
VTGGLALGIDIGGSKTLLMILDISGKIIGRNSFPTSPDISKLSESIHDFLKQNNILRKDILGIGFGIAGSTDSSNGIVIDAPAMQWRNLDIKDALSKKMDYPFHFQFDNDVNSALAGEKWLGIGKNCDPLVYISIGTGLGSSIFANGKFIKGFHYLAGEIGSWLDKDDLFREKKNVLGKFGVTELKVSGTALERNYGSSFKLFEDCKRGVKKAVAIMDEFQVNLSILLANVTSFLNPEKIILGGGIAGALNDQLPGIQSRVREYTPTPVTIDISSLGNDAVAIGAAACIFEKFQGELY